MRSARWPTPKRRSPSSEPACWPSYYAPDSLNAQEIEKFIASRSRMEQYKADFSVEASTDNGQLLVDAMQDEKVTRAELTKARAIVLASNPQHTGRLLSDFNAVKQWFSDNGTAIDRIKKVETEVAGDVVTRARMLEDTEQRNAIITAGLILLLLLLVLGLTVLIARSMVQPLRRLRVEALDVAGFRLPEVVRRLRVSGESQTPDIAPISVDTKDEIGEVAKAFDEVHRQAIRLAAEESELRSNISAMFVNLSRRTQTLVERQISLIDGLEKGEEDGGRLSDLFKLDHLATRMRRNSENLLVLAGHEPTRRRSQPSQTRRRRARLAVGGRGLRARPDQGAPCDLGRGQHRQRHRPPGRRAGGERHPVLPASQPGRGLQQHDRGGGALLAVSDVGIGMTEEELVETNRRLADPPVVDVSVSRRMGLFVVGRLALRHGIRVQLRPQEIGGLVAMVLLPPELMVEMVQPPSPRRGAPVRPSSRTPTVRTPTVRTPTGRPPSVRPPSVRPPFRRARRTGSRPSARPPARFPLREPSSASPPLRGPRRTGSRRTGSRPTRLPLSGHPSVRPPLRAPRRTGSRPSARPPPHGTPSAGTPPRRHPRTASHRCPTTPRSPAGRSRRPRSAPR
ncbi:nitrate- and nitrite sensing domain-containing protein [Streptosporangium lutulentum]